MRFFSTPCTLDKIETQRGRGAGELIEGSEWQAYHGRRATASKKEVHGGEVATRKGKEAARVRGRLTVTGRVGCCKG